MDGLLRRTFGAPPTGGAGPKPSSLSLLLLLPSAPSSAAVGGSSLNAAGGGAGPITRLRFSPPSGLVERAPLRSRRGADAAACSSSSSSSSAWRFLLASRWGGSSGPIEDMMRFRVACVGGREARMMDAGLAVVRQGSAVPFRSVQFSSVGGQHEDALLDPNASNVRYGMSVPRGRSQCSRR